MMLALVDGQRSYAQPKQVGHCELCGGIAIPKCGRINVWHWAHKSLQDCDTWAEPITAWHADWQAHFPVDCCEIPIGRHRADVRSPSGLVIEFQHSALSVDEIRERENHYGSMLWVFDAVKAFKGDRLNLRYKAPHCNSRTYGVWGSYQTYTYAANPPQHKCYLNDDISDNSLCCPLPAQECLTRRFGPRPPYEKCWCISAKALNGHDRWADVLGQDPRPPAELPQCDPYRSFRWKHPRRSLLHCRRPVFLDLGDGCLLEPKKLHPNAPYGGWGYLCTVDAFLARCGLEFTFI